MSGARRNRHPYLAARRRRPLLALASLLAVLLQAFVVQPHIHAPAALVEIAATTNDANDTAVATPVADLHRTIVCAVCQTRAGAGDNLLLGTPAGWAEADFAADASPQALPQSSRVRAHAWQSRAPPLVLEA